jgi:hypothetical protein
MIGKSDKFFAKWQWCISAFPRSVGGLFIFICVCGHGQLDRGRSAIVGLWERFDIITFSGYSVSAQLISSWHTNSWLVILAPQKDDHPWLFRSIAIMSISPFSMTQWLSRHSRGILTHPIYTIPGRKIFLQCGRPPYWSRCVETFDCSVVVNSWLIKLSGLKLMKWRLHKCHWIIAYLDMISTSTTHQRKSLSDPMSARLWKL